MSHSTTLLDLLASSQTQKELTANALLDAASPSMLFGRRASTTSGLTWGYYGGCLRVGGVPTLIANGTLTLTPSATNYIESTAAGVLSVNTVGFTANATPIYSAAVGETTVTSYIDYRFSLPMTSATDLLTAKGDLITRDGTAAIKLAVGADNQVLVADSAEPTGMKWANQTGPFDVTAFYPGTIPESALVTRVPVARAVAFAVDMAGSQAVASAPATASTTLTVRKNGTEVATINYAAASAVGTFSGSAFALAAGDVLSILAPATPDSTLADVGIVLAGTR